MKKIIYFAFILFALSACRKDTYFPDYTGDIKGYLSLFQYDVNVTDYSNVLVTIEANDLKKTTYTNSNGLYIFEDIPTGTYKLTYEKEGFNTNYNMSFGHIGGEIDIADYKVLYKPINATINNLTIDTSFMLTVDAEIHEVCFDSEYPNNFYRYYYFIGLDQNIDYSNYLYVDANLETYYLDYLKSYGKVYCRVYHGIKNNHSNTGYRDITTGNYIHTNINYNVSKLIEVNF